MKFTSLNLLAHNATYNFEHIKSRAKERFDFNLCLQRQINQCT